MSYRRKSFGSRKRRRVWMSLDEEPSSPFLALFSPKTTRGRRKKASPRKITTRRTALTAIRNPVVPAQSTSSEVISLDNTPESAAILSNVNSKIGTFMETGSFISSDEDETEMIKTKSNKKSSPSQFFISDDSDDDCTLNKLVNTTSNFDACSPGTSAGPSSDYKNPKNSNTLDDDIMGFVDAVLDNTSSNKDEIKDSLKDMKSLEDFRKETEEMLKSASSLFEEIKTGRKAEPAPKLEESPPKVTVGSCPICLESLASRPASVTVCGHIFCKECILQTAQTLKKCPTCRKAINAKKIHPIYF